MNTIERIFFRLPIIEAEMSSKISIDELFAKLALIEKRLGHAEECDLRFAQMQQKLDSCDIKKILEQENDALQKQITRIFDEDRHLRESLELHNQILAEQKRELADLRKHVDLQFKNLPSDAWGLVDAMNQKTPSGRGRGKLKSAAAES